jgi:UDP-N-acetylmuramate: L-alanyl-gamma-D-glutamyl-meso-diaminopimelate ligase
MGLKPDMYVIGNVVSRARLADGSPKFPLMEAILEAGAPYTSGPQWLSEHVLQGRHVLAVAGTHGKTTTTSMLAWVLEQAGLQPGFLVGGVPLNFGVSARLGGGHYFVIEADEYDTAFFDKRSKFVHYRPRTAILNNLEFDHADIFDDLAAIERQFHHLVRTVPGSGRVVVNGLEESLTRVLGQGCWSDSAHLWQHGERLCGRRRTLALQSAASRKTCGRGAMGALAACTTSSTHWPPSPQPSMLAWHRPRPQGLGHF